MSDKIRLSGAEARYSAWHNPLQPVPHFNTSPKVIRLAVMLYVRSPLLLRNVEALRH